MKTMRNIAIAALAVVLIATVISFAETGLNYGQPTSYSYNPRTTVTKTADYTLTASDDYVKFTCSTAALTATLPQISSLTKTQRYKILKTDALPLAVTVTPATGDTVGGESTRKLYYQNAYMIITSGANNNWVITYESPYNVEDHESGQVDIYSLVRVPNRPYTSTTTSLTITNAYAGKVVQSNASYLTHTLPLASTVPGSIFTFVSNTTATVVIDPNASDSIIGMPTGGSVAAGDSIISSTAGASLTLYSTGSTSWYTLSSFGTWTDNN